MLNVTQFTTDSHADEPLSIDIHIDGNSVVVVVLNDDDDQVCVIDLDAEDARYFGDALIHAADHTDDGPDAA